MSLAIGNHRLPVTDETWPYPDREGELGSDDDLDLDLLELRADLAAYRGLTAEEREALFLRFGLGDGVPRTVKAVAAAAGITPTEANERIGRAILKLRDRMKGPGEHR